MRKWQTGFWLYVPAVLLLLSTALHAAENGRGKKKNQITVRQTFTSKDVVIEKAKGYDLVTLKNQLMPEDEPGTPWLPAAYINVLIPSGATVTDVTATPVDEILLAKGLNVMPAQPPVPLSGPVPEFVKPNAKAYSSKIKKALFQSASKQTQRGMSYVPVRINPVRLVAATGELYLAQKIDVTVSFKQEKGRRRASKRHFKKFRDSVLSLVVNPTVEDAEPILTAATTTEISKSAIEAESATDDGVAAPLAAGPCDYLVITNSELSGAFAALCNHRQSFNGYSTQIVTVETIEATYPGNDKPEKIRNCIIDYVTNQGTLFVVLGGDAPVVPVRSCYVSAGGYVEDRMPTDLYYAGLDGNWDDDGDHIYGEANGDAGSEGDLSADVLVGRIPVRTSEQATAYINKVINFDNNPRLDVLEKFMMSGKELVQSYSDDRRPTDALLDGHMAFDDPAHTWVSDSEIWLRRLYRDEMQANGYSPMKVGVLLDSLTSWDGTTAGTYAANPTNMVERFSEGWNIVLNLAHGGRSVLDAENQLFTRDHAAILTGPTNFFYTGSCLSGAFDNDEPSMSEAMIRNPNGAALVYIGSSRYNFVGTASYLMGIFFRHVFADGMTNTGEAFYAHKAGLFAIFNGVNRWLTFGINLQGDPALTIVSSAGGQNIPPVVKDTAVETEFNEPIAISVTASDMEGSPITYSIVQAPQNGTLSGTLPNVTYTPNTDYSGADSIVWEASDGTVSSQATVSINVLPFNSAPVIDSIYADPAEITLPTQQTQLYVMASDMEENPLTYQWELLNGPAAVALGTPEADNTSAMFVGPGTYTFLVTVNDGRSTVIDSVSVVVNAATGDDLVSNMVLNYKLDADTGTVATDSSIFGYNGTLKNGPVWQPTGGNTNGSLLFDGVNDYIYVPDKSLINGEYEKRTVALWFKVTDATINTKKQVLFEEGGVIRGLNIYVFDGKLYFGGWNADASESNWTGTFLSTPITSGEWHHATLVIDGTPELTADAMKVYLDGALVGTGAGSKLWGHTEITLGAMVSDTLFDTGTETGTGNQFGGELDEVYIYNRALNASEIASLANTEPPVNTAPVISSVTATPNEITLPTDTTAVAVTATDADGDNLMTIWSKQSGAGTVTFADASQMSTNATFSEAGTYVLLVQVSDGTATVESTVTVTVSAAPANNSPLIEWVTATPDAITLPVDTTVVDVSARDADGDDLTATWSKQSGTGTVTFADANAMSTNATFSEAGTYVLLVQVSDGTDTVESTVTVTVSAAAVNTPPAITSVTATPNAITLPVDTTAVAVVATDADGDNLTATWSKQSGAGTVTFANAGSMSTNATFSEAGTYVLLVQVSDGTDTVESTVTVTVSAAAVNTPPAITSVTATPNAITLPVDTTAIDVVASDVDGDTLSVVWSKQSGAGTVTFADANQMSTNATFSEAGTYVLLVQVSDGEATVEDTVTVTVNSEAGADITSNLVLHYELNETSGTVASDSSASGLDGTVLNGAGWDTSGGTIGGALDLDGVDDSVNIPDSSLINDVATSKRTISVWFKVDDASINTKKQVVYEEGGNKRGLNIYVYDGKVYLGGWNTIESGWAGTFLSAPVSAGEWVHAVLVLDAESSVTADAMSAYVNGVLIGSGEGSQIWSHMAEVLGATDETLYHTGVENATGDYFGGLIDDLRIYNRALNETDISALNAMGAINAAPIAGDSVVETSTDTAVAVTLNATDAEGDALTYSVVSSPAHGILSGTAPNLTYTPSAGYSGSDSFTWKASDGNSDSNVATVTLTVNPAGPDLTTNLVLHYALNETSGTVASDSSVSGLDGTVLNGAAWTTGGVVGGGLDLDGVDDSVTIPDSSLINNVATSKRTISVWFKVDDASINTKKQVVYEEGGNKRGLNIYVYDGKVYFGGWNTLESGWAGTFLSAPVSAGEWVHAVLVLDAESSVTANAMSAYVNGVLIGSGEGSQIWSHMAEVIGATDETLYHTGVENATGDYFGGLIDDLRIYNSVLSQEQINALSAMQQE